MHAKPVESLKWRVHRATFKRAASLVTWSEWAADSLVADYGIDRDRIDVIPPGVILSRGQRSCPRPDDSEITRILFVGGDFERKGGTLLLDAFAQLVHDDHVQYAHPRIELHLVTSAAVEAGPGVKLHRSETATYRPTG